MQSALRGRWTVTMLIVMALVAACTKGSDDASAPATSATSPAAPPSSKLPTPSPTPPPGPVAFDRALRDELLGMARRDQRQLRGRPVADTTEERTARLREIVAEHGWPTFDLVGRAGEDAAWLIAQHADLDPAFQTEALELLRAAVARNQASPGNLAYLEDRVAVAEGRPQSYGTQISCDAGRPKPRTPIRDPGGVDRRRRAAGLEPLADYLTEMRELCGGPA